MDIFKAEKNRKFPEIDGSGPLVPAGWCLGDPLQPGWLQTGKKPQSPGKQKTRKRRKINASGSRSGGIRTRGLLVPNQTRYQTALHLVTGADEGTRTPDLLITNRLLYQLSHIGTTSKRYYNKGKMVCPALFLPAGSVDRQALVCYTAAESEPAGPGRFHRGRNEP